MKKMQSINFNKKLIDDGGLDNKPLVSIVVTTKNEEKNISHCLESIVAQSYKRIEIIVVDNFSTDDTEILARKFTSNFFLLGPERSAQRNFGMLEVASGKYLMYIDADMILSPLLVQVCVDRLENTMYSSLYIPEIILGNTLFSRARRLERAFYDGTPIDGSRFFRADIFKKVGGFDANLFSVGSGEDWDLDKSIKKTGHIGQILPGDINAYDSEKWRLENFIKTRHHGYLQNEVCIYHNEDEFNLRTYLKKKSYYSKGFAGYIKKWGANDPDIKKQFSLKYRYWTVFIENGKWKRAANNLTLMSVVFFLRVMVGIVFLLSRNKIRLSL